MPADRKSRFSETATPADPAANPAVLRYLRTEDVKPCIFPLPIIAADNTTAELSFQEAAGEMAGVFARLPEKRCVGAVCNSFAAVLYS